MFFKKNYILTTSYNVIFYYNSIKKNKNKNYFIITSLLYNFFVNHKNWSYIKLCPHKSFKISNKINTQQNFFIKKKLSKNIFLIFDLSFFLLIFFGKFYFNCFILKSLYVLQSFFYFCLSFKNIKKKLFKKFKFTFIFANFFFNIALSKLFTSFLGTYSKLEILGYARRSWISKKKNTFYLKLGHSYVNKLKVPTGLLLKLVKRRLIILFSFTKRLLTDFSFTVFKLKPSDNYKGFGIRLSLLKLILKNKKKLK